MPKVTDGKVVVPIPSPTFADGDKASSVTKDFTLPLTYAGEDGEETISWSSSNPDVITINGSRAEVKGVLADTEVTLTATTSKTQKTKMVKVTVKSDLEIEFDREYAKPGQLMKASVKNAPADTEFTYVWQKDKSTLSDSDSYTPTSADLNTFITVRASLKSTGATVAEKKIYCSKLPVVYINTKDGYGITSKETYKQATMKIQGNDSFNSTNTTLYDGGISIRGRGNSTWNMGYSKLPYKIKLDSKTNLLGFGNSKHWALLANYMDESLLRNKTSYDLSGKTNSDGEVMYRNLEKGVYLFVQIHTTQIGNQVYRSEPFIITVPGNYDGQIIWNVTAEPKFKNESIPPITTNTPPVSEEPSGDKSSRTPNVKTGDDTNVIMWLSLMGISLVIFSICKRKVHK